MTLLLIISIIGFSLLPFNFKNISGSEGPLIGLCSEIILLYMFAIARFLNVGTFIVLFIGILAIPLTFFLNKKSIKDLLSKLSSTGYLVFILLIIVLFSVCRPIVTGAWDEYSHWALIVKNMLMTGHLPVQDSAVLYITYPPVTSLFQYMFMKISSGPEGMMYYAQAILIAASVSAMLGKQSFKKPMMLVLSIVLPILAVVKFSVHNIFNIFPDYLMVVMAASAFIMYYNSKREKTDAYKLIPIMFMLSLIRVNGLLFAVFSLIAVSATLLGEQTFKKKIMHVLIPLISAIAGILSWQIYMKIAGIHAVLGKNNSALPFDGELFINILDKFKSALFLTKLGTVLQPLYLATSAVAFAFMAAVITVIVHILLKPRPQERRKVLYVNISFFMLFIVYCISLVFGYQFVFTKPEALSLAGYSRYMGTFFMFWIISVFFVLSDIVKESILPEKKKRNMVVALCAAMIIVLAVLTSPSMLNIFGGRRLENVYEKESIECAKEIQTAVGEESKVYLIFQKSRGYSFMGTRYQLGTNLTNLGTWSLGAPYSDSDTWTVDLPPEDFLQRLYDLDYEYVYVANGGDAQLWEGYGELFDKPGMGSTVFKVTEDNEKPLKAVN